MSDADAGRQERSPPETAATDGTSGPAPRLYERRELVSEERERYRELFLSAPVPYLVTGPDGRVVEANRAAGDLLEVEPEQILGRSLTHIVPDARKDRVERRIARLLSSRDRLRFEMTVDVPGRGPSPVDAVAEALRPSAEGDARAVLWVFGDATERVRAERTEEVLRQFGEDRAEAERTARYYSLLSKVPALLSTSPVEYRDALETIARLMVEDGHADYCTVWLRELGTLKEAGSALTEEPTPRVPAQFRAGFGLDGSAVTETLEEILASGEVWLLCEDVHGGEEGSRSVRPRREATGVCRGIVAPLVTGGAPFGALGVFDLGIGPGFDPRDADFVRELAERTALGVENVRLFREAKGALRERDSLQRMASHDLRNGLSSLRLRLEGLRRTIPEDGAEALGWLDRAEKALDRVVEVAEGLDPSVSALGGGALRRESVELEPLIREVLEAHEPAAEERGVSLELDLTGELPAVPADPERLRQVFENLLQNSLKFLSPGGEVVVRVGLDGDVVSVSVLDTGPGLPEEDPDQVFARFWRAEGAADVEGSGLGLSIVKTLVEAHGGGIRARNRDEGGAEIMFTLPVDRTSDEGGSAVDAGSPAPAPGSP